MCLTRSYCYADLPKAGLGNMLLVWARAWVFARLNRLPLIVSSWGRVRVGPILRREAHWRWYFGYFDRRDPISAFERAVLLRRLPRVTEPRIGPAEQCGEGRLYIFNTVPHWADYFQDIKEHRDELREAIYAMLPGRYRSRLRSNDAPVVSVHVRLSDFRPVRPGEDFARTGGTRTPVAHFTDIIRSIRQIHGTELPVTVFSDGRDPELRELLSLPGVCRAKPNPANVDLLLMARSQVIVPSAGSTFSYWSAFLSDAAIILHPAHVHAPLRPERINRHVFEGAATGSQESWPDLLKANVRAIDPRRSGMTFAETPGTGCR